jgi:hypothetical protein
MAGKLRGTLRRLTKWRFELDHYCRSDEVSSLSLHDGVWRPTRFQFAEETLEMHLTVWSGVFWRFVSNSLRN